MIKWRCPVCGYIYDPKMGDQEAGIEPGVQFKSLPDSWGCPDCGTAPDLFERLDDPAYYLE